MPSLAQHKMSHDFTFPSTTIVANNDDQMLFGPLDMDDVQISSTWDEPKSTWDESKQSWDEPKSFAFPSLNYDYTNSPSYQLESLTMSSPTDSYSGSPGFFDVHENALFNNWININEAENNHNQMQIPSPATTVPIPISSSSVSASSSTSETHSPFFFGSDHSHFPQEHGLSPGEFAALHPLPASFDEPQHYERQRSDSITSISPADISSVHTPEWVSGLFDLPASPPSHPTPPTRSTLRRSPLSFDRDHTQRVRVPSRPSLVSSHSHVLSSSAPVGSRGASSMASRRAESVSLHDDRDATVRRRRKLSSPPAAEEARGDKDKSNANEVPLKSALKPPKLAPSAWQLYFTDWIQRQQQLNTRKLNVAQAAKEAGQEYASLSAEEKEPYKRRSLAMKGAREREHAAYMRTLTPEDIKRENAFRAAQRKAGKSRKSNIKDPNAPKKPLSAYFMFLQKIRSDPRLVKEVFGDETETTKQSVLAAARWRSMTDEERKPFLAQAEHEKMEYETARRLYEEGTTPYGSSISFSILPGSPIFTSHIKLESESESDGDSSRHRN
ncbi:hypothetical protein VNI00_001143 [Paramarasmius palmivorus]|uniref:HMG box domain-containing protein n=1 Tax=Paramarasmius palmivorus TaxID=297713 RepID=A0AAW0E5H1_9AGAR